MKKFLFRISLPAVLIMMALCVFVMCKKDVDETTEGPSKDQQYNRSQIVENLVVNFKDKIKYSNDNPGLKLSDPMLMDSCIWYVETTLNFTYADLACEKSNLYFDSVFIEIDLISGRVEISEAITAYNKFEDSLSAQYDDITDANKQFLMSDVFVTASNSSEATLCMLSAFMGGGPINISSFGQNDFWWYGNALVGAGGYCDGPYNGQCIDDDAAEQIERKIRYRLGSVNGRFFSDNDITVKCEFDYAEDLSTGIVYACNFNNSNDLITNDNYYDQLIFVNYSLNPNFHGCLNPDEMNFYLDGLETIISTRLFQCIPTISGLDCISVNMIGQEVVINSTTWWRIHTAYITYGDMTWTTTNTQDL